MKRFENSWISIIRGLQFAAQINALVYLTYEMRLRRAAPGGGMITACSQKHSSFTHLCIKMMSGLE